jgi:hypothetical protein
MIWTEKDFLDNTGQAPEQDDLDRANCKDAGKPGHWMCGICVHKKPVFMCSECVSLPRAELKRL